MKPGRARLVVGLILMLVGAMHLADRFDWWGVRVDVPLWPIVLIALGLVRATNQPAAGTDGSSRTGVWLVFVGCWGLLNEWRLWGITYTASWPLLVVGAGMMIVWGALVPSDSPPRRNQDIR